MAPNPTDGVRQTHVRVGRGLIKVNKYESEQPKPPSDTASLKSTLTRSSSEQSSSTFGSSRKWLRGSRKQHVASTKTATSSAQRPRSRSRSRTASVRTVRRVDGCMRSDLDLVHTKNRPSNATSPSRGGRAEPHGLFPLPIPPRRGDPYSRHQPLPLLPPPPRDREPRAAPPLTIPPTPSSSTPSPGAQSWVTDSDVDPAADQEMWSTIGQLEDELVAKFGRDVVPSLRALRQERQETPPQAQATSSRIVPEKLSPPPPPPSVRPLAPRKPRRNKSAASALVFPLPPTTLPHWVINTPLPTPPSSEQSSPSSPSLRARIGPPPPFAPPPKFRPPPIPSVKSERDAQTDTDALAALYNVLQITCQPGATGSAKLRESLSRVRSSELGAVTKNRRRTVIIDPKPQPKEGVPGEETDDESPAMHAL